ncbi:MAG: hypothetical protein ACJLS2_01955 [Microcella pacifica]
MRAYTDSSWSAPEPTSTRSSRASTGRTPRPCARSTRSSASASAAASASFWEGVFWGGTEQRIIGYARIEQPRPKGESVEWFLLGLAQQQKHVSLYVNAVADGGYLLAQYQGRLGSLKQGAAALTIPSLEKADLDGLASLVDDAFATLTS